jgi:aspartate racemase
MSHCQTRSPLARLAILLPLLGAALAWAAPGGADTAAPPPAPAAGAPPAAAPAGPARRQTRVIGIIGGIAWPSSLEYYRIMNEQMRDALGPPNSAEVLLYSISFGDFAKQERLAEQGDWAALTQTMVQAGKRLKQGGADFIVIASNTMNSTAETVAREAGIPVLHIADAVGQAIQAKGLGKVALLGTRFTMDMPFYRDRLKEHGVEVVIPTEAEREEINTIIFDELVNDILRPESKARFLAIIDRMTRDHGIQGVILGCTEIPLLIKPADVALPTFDSMTIHATAAVEHALTPAQTDGRR